MTGPAELPARTTLPFDPIARAAQRWEEEFGPAGPMRVATSIMRAQQLLIARFDAALKPYGITFARYEVLVLLRFAKTGSLPLKVVGERLQVHPTSVTNSVARLVAAGLVARRPNPADGRGALAELTLAGREVVARATTDLMSIEFGLGALTEPGLDDVFDRLCDLRRSAGDFTD